MNNYHNIIYNFRVQTLAKAFNCRLRASNAKILVPGIGGQRNFPCQQIRPQLHDLEEHWLGVQLDTGFHKRL